MADTPTQNFGSLPDTLTFGPFNSTGEVTVHLVNLVEGCPPYVENIGVPFVCAGEGYGSFTLVGGTGEQYLYMVSSSDYFTLRDSMGSEVTYPAGSAAPEPGIYCIWASDDVGVKTGQFVNFELGPISSVDMSGFQYSGFSPIIGGYSGSSFSFGNIPNALQLGLQQSASTSVDIASNLSAQQIQIQGNVNLSSISLPPTLTSAFILYFQDNALDVTTVDGIIALANTGIVGVIQLQGGTNAAPSGASTAKLSALVTAGWTVTTN